MDLELPHPVQLIAAWAARGARGGPYGKVGGVATAVGTHVGPWSEEDLLGLPEDAQRYELLEGTLLVNPLPGGVHQRISFRLTSLLDAAVLHDLVVVEAMGVRLPDNTVFIPDILVATRDVVLANDSGILDAGTVALVAEIVSPGSRTPDRITKPAVYASAGIDSFWRVEPEDGRSSPVLPRDTRGAACPTAWADTPPFAGTSSFP
jgi:Uma2 family endonuclease